MPGHTPMPFTPASGIDTDSHPCSGVKVGTCLEPRGGRRGGRWGGLCRGGARRAQRRDAASCGCRRGGRRSWATWCCWAESCSSGTWPHRTPAARPTRSGSGRQPALSRGVERCGRMVWERTACLPAPAVEMGSARLHGMESTDGDESGCAHPVFVWGYRAGQVVGRRVPFVRVFGESLHTHRYSLL